MQRLTIKYRPRKELHAYDRNPRTHSADQVLEIAESIKQFGWTNPIIIDEQNGIIAGHGRLQAADLLHIDNVPTIQLKNVDENTRRALVIADNKLALNAGWDEDLLRDEINLLSAADFNIDVLGFTENELQALDDFEADTGDSGNSNPDPTTHHSLLIECDTEAQAEQLFEELEQRGLSVRIIE